MVVASLAASLKPERVDNQSTITSPTNIGTVQEAVKSFVQSSGIDLKEATWLALTDKVSAEFSTVTLAQVRNEFISDISAKLSAYQGMAEELAVVASTSSEFGGLMDDSDNLEKELSFLIGQASIQKTASFSVGSPELLSKSDVFSSLVIGDTNTENNNLLQVEISGSDYLNGYHFADGCPICRAEMAALGASTANNPELDETETNNSSN